MPTSHGSIILDFCYGKSSLRTDGIRLVLTTVGMYVWIVVGRDVTVLELSEPARRVVWFSNMLDGSLKPTVLLVQEVQEELHEKDHRHSIAHLVPSSATRTPIAADYP